jgi:polyribonucleotide nucleotidyltransferase
MHILSEMLKTQGEVAPELSPYAPLIMSLMVPEDKIRTVIGKGGETIQRIQAEHDVTISIDDTGMTSITAKTQEGGKAAVAEITEILWTPEV